MKRRTQIVVGVLVAGAVAAGAALWWFDDGPPTGRSGAEADALARLMQRAVNLEAWHRTGAVKWNFGGRHRLLWDRTRDLVEVRWEDRRVLRTTAPGGPSLAFQGETRLGGAEAEAASDKAYALFCNDSFWLNPIDRLFDSGTERELIDSGEGARLLVRHGRGGVTPGDTYVWHPDEDGLPQAWQMWVSIIPVGGMRASWERWIELDTGARVATLHDMGVRKLVLSDVAGARTLEALVGNEDPFTPLILQAQMPEPTSMPH